MNYALRLPDYYKKEIENLKGEVSINQFIVNAVAEKIASLKTEDYLMQRAKNGSREHALNLLNQVGDSPAEKQDQLY
ncbi:CopG family transcriptional regulator [Thiomicrospira microaerophila]|uniref:CopG family transcriptional regulator n=1 Tax=Thiomicrospira microaerophila TaxID=406020 RepID=UPI00200BE0A6|nr:CopG family transcriptional regulator [Thiomicrospira microaerophila]UQB41532.1 CopG family transcriptional regulator [Thiomicrospira microaerophila]